MATADTLHDDLIAAVRAAAPHAVALRRDLHRMPEPGGDEVQTAARIAEELADMSATVRTGVGGQGVVADLHGRREGGYVLLRADMDALPMEDRSEEEYRSLHPGYSHACGHDGHMAILLGTVHVLAQLRPRLAGRVRFVFQPAEEKATGAKAMLADGLLDDGRPDAALALHAWPELPSDVVASRPGVIAASLDPFAVRVRGHGGHSARPHRARNPLDGMARLIQVLPTLSSPERTVTICMSMAGGSDNVIPEEGTLAGSARALDEELQRQTRQAIRELAHQACDPLELCAEVSFRSSCPPVINDGRLFEELVAMGREFSRFVQVRQLDAPSMGGEDFAVFAQQIPGLLIRLGTGNPEADGNAPLLHTPEFAFNDRAVPTGMLVLAGMALRLCSPDRSSPKSVDA